MRIVDRIRSSIRAKLLGQTVEELARELEERKKAEAALAASEGKLRKARDELEVRVEERTAEVTRVNESLRTEVEEHKRTSEQLQEVVQRLEEVDAARAQFVSNVSHELRTPVTAIRYAADNMKKGMFGPHTDEALEYLDMMSTDCRRLLGTINDILDVSQIEAGSLKLSLIRVAFARLVRRTVESPLLHAHEKDVELNASAPDDTGFVEVDPDKLGRAILNIVRNGIKFTPDGGEVNITLRSEATTGELVLEVSDTGIGIPAEHLQRVTERYFRVGEHVSGTGLGLPIAKEIIELHGGSLELVSPPPGKSEGTLVTIRMPAVPAPTVLVANDNVPAREAVSAALSSYGYTVIESGNGDDALDALQTGEPDVLVLDLATPGLEGLQVMSGMGNGGDITGIPILALTDEDIDAAKQDFLRGAGIRSFAKPWASEALVGHIEATFMGSPFARG